MIDQNKNGVYKTSEGTLLINFGLNIRNEGFTANLTADILPQLDAIKAFCINAGILFTIE